MIHYLIVIPLMLGAILMLLKTLFDFWAELKRDLFAILLLCSCAVAGAQDVGTLSFDYWIEQEGQDSLYNLPATIVIEENAVVVKTPHEYYSRIIVARGVSDRTGEKMLFFANCDKIRFCTHAGVVDGVFVSNRGRTLYFGVDPDAEGSRGWSNKTRGQ